MSCELRLASGETRRFGQEPPEVIVTLHKDDMLQRELSEYALGKAYVDGEFDVEAKVSLGHSFGGAVAVQAAGTFPAHTAGVITLGTLNPGWNGNPTDIAADGTIVGFDSQLLAREAWIRPAGGNITRLSDYLTDLGATDVPFLDVAQAISTDGRVIIGHSFGVGGWIATLPAPCPADFNGDDVVNAADLAVLLGVWGDVGPFSANPDHPADFNDDDMVDAADLAVMLGAWGPCV